MPNIGMIEAGLVGNVSRRHLSPGLRTPYTCMIRLSIELSVTSEKLDAASKTLLGK